jgi:hypothetical protein
MGAREARLTVADAPTISIAVGVILSMAGVFCLAALALAGVDAIRRRRRLRRLPAMCSFCKKPREGVEKLIAGPGVAICDACTRQCMLQLAAHDRGEHSHSGGGVLQAYRCSFCNKGQEEARVMLPSADCVICDECVAVCRSILSQDALQQREADE